MKNILAVLLVLFWLTPRASTADETRKTILPAGQYCTVDRGQLNPDYDIGIDYVNDIPTDFFLLVYSNSPRFCQYMEAKGRLEDVAFQCASGNNFGWVIHGLWGESRAGFISKSKTAHPRFCKGDLAPVSLDLLARYICMSPGTRLLQGEWEKHGACDFDTAEAYFETTLNLYKRYKIPSPDLTPKEAVEWMKLANATLSELNLFVSKREFGVCFARLESGEFEPMSCPQVKN
ncbi:ribonuclease T2 family protein [Spongorhabdus nitratireducens]